MKRNKDFILRNIAGEYVMVATGDAAQGFNGMITLNEIAAFIWENIDESETVDNLIKNVLNEFDIDEKTVREDVEGFTSDLIKAGMIIA